MWRQKLEVAGEQRAPGTWVFAAKGNLFGSRECYAFQDEVRQRIAEGAKRVVIDLSGVTRINSSGVGILVTMMWSASNAGAGLVLAALSPGVESILGIAMLLNHIDHAGTVEDALAKLEGMELEPTL